MTKTLVLAAGVALVAKPASEASTLLVEERPGKRPKPWRAVPNGDVAKHVREWARNHGVTVEEQGKEQ